MPRRRERIRHSEAPGSAGEPDDNPKRQ
jgi:hypothetical protein